MIDFRALTEGIRFAGDGYRPILAVVAGLVLLAGVTFSLRRRLWVAGALSTFARAAALGIVVFFLLEPETTLTTRHPGTILVAVDASRSTDPKTRRAAYEQVLALPVATGRNWRAVAFGERPESLSPEAARPSERLDGPGDLVSDPLPALTRLLLDPEADGRAARLLLLTDGSLKPPGPAPAGVARLRPLVIPLVAAKDSAFTAGGLALSRPAVRNEPVQLALRGHAANAGTATLRLHVDGREVHTIAQAFGAGSFEIPLTLPALEPGSHLVSVHAQVGDDDSADNGAACVIDVMAAPVVMFVSAARKPLVADALEAQELSVRRVDIQDFLAKPAIDDEVAILVLDRVPAAALSQRATLASIRRHVESGGGLVYFPSEDSGEMFDAAEKPFLDLLPLAGREPRRPEPPKKEEKPPEEGEGPLPPDPESKTKEKRLAPSLGLLLVIDASGSMRGETLLLAKQAAIAAAEVLHPEDYVGVIAFNTKARVVLELTKSKEAPRIRERIARIQADGGTHFANALQLAYQTFEGDPEGSRLGIRHVILVSDGESQPCAIESLVKQMTAKGITISTVGCGSEMDQHTLSNIAAWGRGKFQPAYSSHEIPQVFTIEAERLIQQSGARRRSDARPDPHAQDETAVDAEKPPEPARKEPTVEAPKPPVALPVRTRLPAPYLKGIDPTQFPGVVFVHPSIAKPGSWVALATEGGEPVLAHGVVGRGRVAAWTMPAEGASAVHLVGFDGYQVLMAQLARFVARDTADVPLHLEAAAMDRTIRVSAFERGTRRTDYAALRLDVEDDRGAVLPGRIEGPDDNGWKVRLDPRAVAAAARIRVRRTTGDPSGVAVEATTFATVPPPPEIRGRRLDLLGLESWALALEGKLAPRLPEGLDVPERVTVLAVPVSRELLAWVPWILLLDLALKRLLPERNLPPKKRRRLSAVPFSS